MVSQGPSCPGRMVIASIQNRHTSKSILTTPISKKARHDSPGVLDTLLDQASVRQTQVSADQTDAVCSDPTAEPPTLEMPPNEHMTAEVDGLRRHSPRRNARSPLR